MRVGIEWLRDWVDVDLDAEHVAALLTTAGLEVDAVERAAGESRGLVAARVLELGPHPKADRLTLCTVDDGTTRHEVVCGAPNVAAGIMVPFAPVGSMLPGGRVIDAVELRGVVSNGMLCSARELGLHEDVDGLLILDEGTEPGTPLARQLKLDDHVLDIDLTPNRGDCYSVVGLARELALHAGKPFSEPALVPAPAEIDDRFAVNLLAPGDCPRFAGRVVRGVATGTRSPVWMRERLHRAGLRPIHPIVDVTNYVMLELGQPLHAYRLDRLAERIDVRRARAGERLALLDGREVELDPETLVIADATGPVGLAGIMGGSRTAVDADTVDVLFEAAFFAPAAVLGRARRFGLHTDASLRFERGVDYALPRRAIERATRLLVAIAGGRPGPTDVYEHADALPSRHSVRLRARRLEALLGIAVGAEAVDRILTGLGMRVDRDGDDRRVVPPSFRYDIEREEDLVEEVGRVFGYDNIPAVAGLGASDLSRAEESRVDDSAIADALVARGYTEVVTYGFVSPAAAEAINPGAATVRLANPISSDLSVLRRSLWPGLLQTAQDNLSRQQTRLRIFELGRRFVPGDDGTVAETDVLAGLAVGPRWPEHWDMRADDVDFFDVKGDVEALLQMTGRASEVRFEADVHPALKPGQCARIRIGERTAGWIGCVHPQVQSVFDLKKPAILFALQTDTAFAARVPAYERVSRFPHVRRDLALVVDETVTVQQILDYVQRAGGALLKRTHVFDLYRGQGVEASRKSIGLGLILQDTSRTLTDQDADRAVQSVAQTLEHELGATIRT